MPDDVAYFFFFSFYGLLEKLFEVRINDSFMLISENAEHGTLVVTERKGVGRIWSLYSFATTFSNFFISFIPFI